MRQAELPDFLERYQETFGVPYPLVRAGPERAVELIAAALARGAPLSAAELPHPPELIAHRGYASRYPENTLEGLAAAVAAGARWVEFDVQLSHDRVPVVLHDPTLRRTAGRPESALQMSAAELLAVEVNESRRLGGAFDGVKIPLLSQAVAALSQWPGVTAFVEIKRQSLAAFGIAATVARVLEDLGPLLERCVVISFDARALAAARRRAGCAIGWVLRSYRAAARRTAARMQPEYLFCNYKRLPPEPARLWTGRWRWACYEVTDPALAWRLARRGVALIETMAIAEMLASLNVQPDMVQRFSGDPGDA